MELIDRNAFVKQLEDYIEHAENFEFQMAVIGVVNDLKKQPTVDAEPVKHGKWRHYERILTCSECGTMFYDDIMEYCGDAVPRYCPECGADMRGEQK